MLSWHVTTSLIAALVVATAVASCVDVAVAALSFASPVIVVPEGIVVSFFAFAILGGLSYAVLTAVTFGRSAVKGRAGGELFKRRSSQIGALVVAVAIGLGMFQLARLPGVPGYDAYSGRYYFDDHGSITYTDRAHYLAASAVQARTFATFAFAFTTILFLLARQNLASRRAVGVPPLSTVDAPIGPPPRFAVSMRGARAVVAAGVVVGLCAVGVIVTRVNAYLAGVIRLTTTPMSYPLTAGPWVVFVMCEDHSINPDYSCATIDPADVAIVNAATGTTVSTSPDPSSDNISPGELPAIGQLVLTVPHSGQYLVSLNRPIAKGALLARSPGSVARSLALWIALAVVALAAAAAATFGWLRWLRWRYALAPPVEVPPLAGW
jgi:hypothetical protein